MQETINKPWICTLLKHLRKISLSKVAKNSLHNIFWSLQPRKKLFCH